MRQSFPRLPPGSTVEGALAFFQNIMDTIRSSRFAGRQAPQGRTRAATYYPERQDGRVYGPMTQAEWNRQMGNRWGFNARGQPDLPSYQLPPYYQYPPAARNAASPPPAAPPAPDDQGSIDYRYPYLTPNYNNGMGPLQQWEMPR